MRLLLALLALAVAGCAGTGREVQTAVLPGGLALEYVEQGDPAGVPVLLLHGYTDSWRSFEPVLPHLPAHLRAIALSQRGHGGSARPAGGYRTRDFAQDAAQFLQQRGLGPAIVVGHSMGSAHALRLAIDHPELVRGVVLVAGFDAYSDNPVLADFWQGTVSRLADPLDPAFVREFQQGTLAQPVPDAFLDLVVSESLRVPARVWVDCFRGFLEDDFTSELGRVRAPALILWGDRDALCTREDQDALQAALAGSRLVVYQGAGHALHWEEPERFARELVGFVEGVGAGPTGR